jgi:uncharacterized membrane protein
LHAVQVLSATSISFSRSIHPPLSGDTLASEIGTLSSSSPRLITNGRRVPPGTNGAITLLGTAASAVAGAAVGASFGFDSSFEMLRLTCIGALAGICGSLLDSVIGATLQYSALDASGKRVLSSRAEADTVHGSQHISGRDVLSNAQVGSRYALYMLCRVCDTLFFRRSTLLLRV